MQFTIFTVLALFGIGFYCVLVMDNLIKKVIGINIIEAGLFLLLVAYGRIPGAQPPIITTAEMPSVDPLPQALALTAIVIGASTTALMLAVIIKIYRRYRTLDIRVLRRLRG